MPAVVREQLEAAEKLASSHMAARGEAAELAGPAREPPAERERAAAAANDLRPGDAAS